MAFLSNFFTSQIILISMKKIKILLFDLFFIISSIIGVGFATGKEIAHFFVSGKSVVIAKSFPLPMG